MTVKLFLNDFKRNKVINLTLFLFLFLSSLLIASALFLTTVLLDGIDQLTTAAETPHFVQMHAGALSTGSLDSLNSEVDYISDHQIQEMISIDGSQLYLGDLGTSEARSVMDMSLVKQPDAFDYLLGPDNEPATIASGEIGVPLHFRSARDLEIGDPVTVRGTGFEETFRIAVFLRDSQMNPALVSSKRFLVSDEDFNRLSGLFPAREHLVSYRFDSEERIDDFARRYADSGGPQTGPAVDIRLFRMINGLTDGILILVFLLAGLLLTLIGLLCLRYTLLATLEEDIREIGAMKAIGIRSTKIRSLYLGKYMLLTLFAVGSGYLTSLAAGPFFTKNITRFMGRVSPSFATRLFPLVGVGLLIGFVAIGVLVILRRVKQQSVLGALTQQGAKRPDTHTLRGGLTKSGGIPVDVFLGWKALASNLRSHLLIVVIFLIASFLLILPLHLYNTLSSPTFAHYMGVSTSDLRMDLRSQPDTEGLLQRLEQTLSADEVIDRYAVLRTFRMETTNPDGEPESLPVEVGDLSLFPLAYTKGRPPVGEDEIALSQLAADSLALATGDTLRLEGPAGVHQLLITGLYQDITNGGKTAKTEASLGAGDALWYVVYADLSDGHRISDTVAGYGSLYPAVKVTDIESYLEETLGGTRDRLLFVTLVTGSAALAIGALITALFLKMLLAKEAGQMAILKSIGFTRKRIARQYQIRMLTLLTTGILLGTLASVTLGEGLISATSAILGASELTLIIEPVQTLILLPLALFTVVSITTTLSLNGKRQATLARQLVQ